MWFFKSPEIAFGEDSLSYLDGLEGQRALIVSDATLVQLGYAGRVQALLARRGFAVAVFSEVEPDPAVETVRAGARAMLAFQPDWVIGLGGGSVLDAAKGMWILYERPDVDPEGINPVEKLGLRRKARFVAIPTTSGTGSEATWALVLTNVAERRKMGLGNREDMPDIAIVDPSLVMTMPPRLTADTGLDALTHAVEGFTSLWHNDFADGLCLKSAQLVMVYLRTAYRDGSDIEARSHMHNAATLAGLGFGNSMAALAHGLGHALGGVFHLTHGCCVSLALPYTIEFCLRGEAGSTRYAELAKFLDLPCGSEMEAGMALAAAIRQLEQDVDQPLSLAGCGITANDLEREMDLLIENANRDTQTITSTRSPSNAELCSLFQYLFTGKPVDF